MKTVDSLETVDMSRLQPTLAKNSAEVVCRYLYVGLTDYCKGRKGVRICRGEGVETMGFAIGWSHWRI